MEILNQHNVAAPVIDLSYQDSPPIRRTCQAGPAPSLLVKLADGPNSSCGEAKELEQSIRFGTVIHEVDALGGHSPEPRVSYRVSSVIDIHDQLFGTTAAGHSPDLWRQIVSIVCSRFLVVDELSIGGLLSVASALPRDLDCFFASKRSAAFRNAQPFQEEFPATECYDDFATVLAFGDHRPIRCDPNH